MSETSSELNTRPSLLMRLREGDNDAWQTFVTIYTPLIFGYCRKHGLQEADAADVAQEVLAGVARSVRTFRYQPERGRFRDWLGTVTRSKMNRYLHNQAQGARGAGGDDADASLDELAAIQADTEWTAAFNASVLQVALERIRPHFEPPSWQAFESVWVENRPAAEVARELGLGVAAVYVAKSRVLKRLHDEILMLAEDIPHFIHG
jgi:RNA polymerase sigma factor (sigma-70 family)